MKNVEINFGSTYEFRGADFEADLKEALSRIDLNLESVSYRRPGEGGAILVEGEWVGNEHPVHEAIKLAEEWQTN